MRIEIGAAMLAAAVILLAEHYWLKHFRLSLPARYVAGVLGLALPLSMLLWSWADSRGLVALWSVTGAGGLAVLISYLIDHLVESRARLAAAEQDMRTLRDHQHGQD